jgi:hypothetical protein
MFRRHAQFQPLRHDAGLVIAAILLIVSLGRHQPWGWPQAATARHAGSVQAAPSNNLHYFGGHALHGAGTRLELGTRSPSGVRGWLSALGGAMPVAAPSCLASLSPGLAAGSPGAIAQDLPGLYGAPWVASLNGNLIAALHLAVPRSPSRQLISPVLQIYRRGALTPVFSQAVPVSVVRGPGAVLYRMFIDGPIRCIDLVIPDGTGRGAAYVYYPFRGALFEVEGIFIVQR